MTRRTETTSSSVEWLFALAHGLPGIGAQVHHHLVQLRGVGKHVQRRVVPAQADGHARGQRGPQQGDRLAHHRADRLAHDTLPSEDEVRGARRQVMIATHLVAVIPLPAAGGPTVPRPSSETSTVVHEGSWTIRTLAREAPEWRTTLVSASWRAR